MSGHKSRYNPQLVAQYYGLPVPVVEFRFHPTRRWRFDVAWPERKIAVEIQGGVWSRGRHSRGTGQLADMDKLNTAQSLGWRVLYCTPTGPQGLYSNWLGAHLDALFHGDLALTDSR